MKRRSSIIYFFAVCIVSSMGAQPTLTAIGINPANLDVFVLKYGAYISAGSAGANQTWNLSTITPTSTTSFTAGPASGTTYSAAFMASSNMQTNEGTNFNYMDASANALKLTGQAGPGFLYSYTDPEDLLHYPFNMNNTYTDNWAVTYTTGGNPVTRTGTTIVTYDGYGTLITPAGTFSNTVRINFLQKYKDVGQFSTTTFTNAQYMWYANSFHYPLASVYTVLIGGGGSVSGSLYMEATPLPPPPPPPPPIDVSVSSVITEISDFIIFPSPANDKISFIGIDSANITSVLIYDLNGKLVMNENFNFENPAGVINVQQLGNGVYIVEVKNKEGATGTKKLTLQK